MNYNSKKILKLKNGIRLLIIPLKTKLTKISVNILLGESHEKKKRDRIKIAREANFVLAGREARVSAPKSIAFPPQNQWTALCAANQKVGQFSESQILVCLYSLARTYFIKNC